MAGAGSSDSDGDSGSDSDSERGSGSDSEQRAAVGLSVAVGKVTSGSFMPLQRVAAGAAGVKGEPASSRSLRDP